jgi:arsenate reductase (glutaredoxin)
MTVYGIKNCDSVQKAMKWLTKNKIKFEFHDYKLSGIDEDKVKQWSRQLGWEKLLNKKSTTWRELDEATQLKITDEKSAIALMKSKTSSIKRPLIEVDGKAITIGFNEDEYQQLRNSVFKV